jgi:hypothetical protein
MTNNYNMVWYVTGVGTGAYERKYTGEVTDLGLESWWWEYCGILVGYLS